MDVFGATKDAQDVQEEITYIGPMLDVTCSKINGEAIIDYDLRKTESTFMHNHNIPWCGPRMQLIIQPDDQPGEFILDEDVRGKHIPDGIQITNPLFEICVRKTSRIFLRFKRGRCVHFRVDYN